MASPFLVPVAQLLREVPSRISVELTAPFDADHEFEPRAATESDVVTDAEATVAVRVESFRGGLRVRGTVSAPWRGICRRCSVEILGVLEVPVNERYVENAPPEDEESYPIEGDFIDLAPLLHDAIFLELPIAPLCKEDCAGLCPRCGIDRNEATCDCQPEVDPRWARLDALRSEDDSSQ